MAPLSRDVLGCTGSVRNYRLVELPGIEPAPEIAVTLKLATRNDVKRRETTCGYARGVDDINMPRTPSGTVSVSHVMDIRRMPAAVMAIDLRYHQRCLRGRIHPANSPALSVDLPHHSSPRLTMAAV